MSTNIKQALLLVGMLIPYVLFSQDEIEFRVAGKCNMCKDRIEAAAKSISGTLSADWNSETQLLFVYGEGVSETELQQAIANAGHDTKKFLAKESAYAKLPACCKYRSRTDLHAPNFNSLSFSVSGNCDMCKARIEKAAISAGGVQFATWDAEAQQLTIEGTDLNSQVVQEAVAYIGHDTENVRAADNVYAKLHTCCKYRDKHVLHPKISTEKVIGQINGVTKNGREPLAGASLHWLGTTIGTASDANGNFNIDVSSQTDKLVVRFVGYQNDTLIATGGSQLQIELNDELYLQEVNVVSRKKTSEISHIKAIKTINVSEGELLKAACCNLSESFDTNPTVDVSFTDAVTGTKQIQMLGLAGPYVQITRENIPDVRGLAAIQGFTYTPGTWIESIQLNLGTGSVANGFESVTGQINVELKKPEDAEKLYVNLFSSHIGQFEANANFMQKLNKKWSTGVLLHGKYFNNERDVNEDGFLDAPLSKRFVVLNRWRYHSGGTVRGQFGVKATFTEKLSGQTNAHNNDNATNSLWGASMNTKRMEAWGKIGYVSTKRPTRSLGFQLSGVYHGQASLWGARSYDATQKGLYANLIFQDVFSNTDHKYRFGVSFVADNFDETVSEQTFIREETIPGAFFEYTYSDGDKFTAVAGLRGDYHNRYGFFVTPRLHLRFAPTDATVLRTSVGRAQRTASIFAENIGAFASSREFVVHSTNSDKPYGLDAEVAWNFGANLTQQFKIAGKELQLGLDFFHTRFANQIVVDFDQNPQEVHFYNLSGESYANSLQAQLDFEILPRWDVRLAYRLNDVWVDYEKGRNEKPLTNRFRAFVNTGYATKSGWSFDFTANLLGRKRIPDTHAKPPGFRLDERSPSFTLFNAQISKKWKRFEIYAGGENLLDYRQENPIIDAENPFGENFDASLVWGPVMGRRLYVGLRFRVE